MSANAPNSDEGFSDVSNEQPLKPDHETARFLARAMSQGVDPEYLLRIEAGARRRKPATPPHTMPEPRDPREPNPERVPFPPPQTRDAVSDFRARKLISRIERPAKIAEWLDLITDTVSAWADANRRASPTDQQVADWGGWSWNGSECYAPRWHHAPFELNPEYAEMAERRIRDDNPLFSDTKLDKERNHDDRDRVFLSAS